MLFDSLTNRLNLNEAPVLVTFTDDAPEKALRFKSGKRGCIASMLLAISRKGGCAAFDECTYGCPGGGIGIGFSDAFEKTNYTTAYYLARGNESFEADGLVPPRDYGMGERFFTDMPTARKWMDDLPVIETRKKTVVLESLDMFDTANADERTLVVLFVDPNQLAAISSMLGFLEGSSLNIIAPFASACQSILFAEAELKKQHPMAVLGFLDVAQRHRIDTSLMTLTLSFERASELEGIVAESVLATPAWERLRDGREASQAKCCSARPSSTSH